MVQHYIIMANSYFLAKRIALHYFDKSVLQMDVIINDIEYIIDICGKDIPISTHMLITNNESWESVAEKDGYFKDVIIMPTREAFVEMLRKDRNLVGLDVAKYILTQVPCTHLKLEKLTYMCYADYLCEEKEKLFQDKIYAYRLGPVIDSVYDKFKNTEKKYLGEDDEKSYSTGNKMPSKSRILSAENGLKKLSSIDKTIQKYGHLSASELVKLTHQDNSPWTESEPYKTTNQEITDELIITFHKNETI